MMIALHVPFLFARGRRKRVSNASEEDYDEHVINFSGGPKLNLTAASSPIPMADPKPLFWVAGIVLGLLAAWVLYVVFTGETRKPPTEAEAPSSPKASDGAE